MKQNLVAALLLFSLAATAQTKKPLPAAKVGAAKAAIKLAPAIGAAALKTITDSASYAIGVSVANFYSQQGMSSINSKVVARAIEDVLAKKTPLMSEQQCNTVMMQLMNGAQEKKSQPQIDAGTAFLAQNKTKSGVKTTASGLQYEVLTEGTGVKPTETDTVTVNYIGTLINGEEFDNSYKRGKPISFPLNGVIRGWTEGVQLMSTGSKYKFYIPYELGYGTNEAGSIPPGSTLIFEVQLLEVNGKK
jgi:FKBP-type peptidyl-prolyl cis-trans isomerase